MAIPSALPRGRFSPFAAGLAVVAEGAGDLLGQPVVQAVDQLADVVRNVAPIQILPPAVAGVEDLPQIAQDVDDFAIARQRAMAEVVDRAALSYVSTIRCVIEASGCLKVRDRRSSIPSLSDRAHDRVASEPVPCVES